jgi:hypothetical protein
MFSAAAVVVCALALLGRSERTMPPIELVEVAPHLSAGVEAFVREPYRTIYLVTSSPVFQEAQRSREACDSEIAMKKLASILAHEEWHVKHGPDERAAYEAQLTTLLRLGVQPGSGLYIGVVRSMLTVLKKRPDKPDMMLAGKQ